MSEEANGPLIIMAEERPVYFFCGAAEVVCPGDNCPIKKAFVPFGRGIIRVIDSAESTSEGGLICGYVQKEEFVIRSCEECRYNPVARAVIDELVNPKSREDAFTATYTAKNMHSKLKLTGISGGFSGPHHPGGLDDFFKEDYFMPGIAKDMAKGALPVKSKDEEYDDDDDTPAL
jgi:hypothetical protein